MKRMLLLILVVLFVTSCDSQSDLIKEGQAYKNFRDFEPTDATEYDGRVKIVVNNAFVEKEIKLLSSEEILSFLNNETVLVSIGQITADGVINYVPVTLSAKGSSYKVTMDYMKFATLGQATESGEFLGFKRVGVGLRLISHVNRQQKVY